MRILHISSQQPDQTGSGIYIQEIMEQAQAAGHENALLASLPTTKNPPANLACTQSFYLRFETEELPFAMPGMSDIMPYSSSVFGNMEAEMLQFYLDQLQKHLQKAVDQFQPEIIHSNHLWLISSLIRQIAPDIPVVVSCHGSDLRQFHNCSHLRDLVLHGCTHIDHVFALTKEQKQTISNLYTIEPDKISVVGSGVNSHLFCPPARPRSIRKPLKLLYAGKLSRSKGVPYLLKALTGLEKEIHLTIAGDGIGDEAKECHALMASLLHQVRYIGKISQNELAREMQNADIFILPSLFEGMPLVVLEALSCQCQVLATALPGVLEIAEKTSNPALHLIPMPQVHHVDQLHDDQKDHFTTSIHKTLRQVTKTIISGDAQTGAIDYFHWESVYKRIGSIYEDCSPSA